MLGLKQIESISSWWETESPHFRKCFHVMGLVHFRTADMYAGPTASRRTELEIAMQRICRMLTQSQSLVTHWPGMGTRKKIETVSLLWGRGEASCLFLLISNIVNANVLPGDGRRVMTSVQTSVSFTCREFIFINTNMNCGSKRTTASVYISIFQLTDQLSKSNKSPSSAVSGVAAHRSVI